MFFPFMIRVSLKAHFRRLISGTLKVVALLLAVAGVSNSVQAANAPKAAATEPSKKSQAEADGKLASVSKADLKSLRSLDQRYQSATSITMDVEKNLKLGLLGQERQAKGKLFLSSGRMRMELEGSERSLLVVNKKNLWAVTYPDPEFKDAAVQVIKGETATKKGRSQNFVTLLTQGGFLKFFKATGVQKLSSGEAIYFLVPEKEQTDFKRAQMKVSKDGKQILELKYWDERDNETRFIFSGIKFGTKALEDKLFTFTPPANADVMSL